MVARLICQVERQVCAVDATHYARVAQQKFLRVHVVGPEVEDWKALLPFVPSRKGEAFRQDQWVRRRYVDVCIGQFLLNLEKARSAKRSKPQ